MFNPRKTVNCDYLSCTKEASIQCLHSPEIDKLKEILHAFTQLKVLTGSASATKIAADGSEVPLTGPDVGLDVTDENTLSDPGDIINRLVDILPVYFPNTDASTH